MRHKNVLFVVVLMVVLGLSATSFVFADSRSEPVSTATVSGDIDTPVIASRPGLASPPENDDTSLEINGLPTTITQDTREATIGVDDPELTCPGLSGQGYNSVSFYYAPYRAADYLRASTEGSDYDTVLVVSLTGRDSETEYVCINDNVPGTQNEEYTVPFNGYDYPFGISWMVVSKDPGGGNLVFTLGEAPPECDDATEPNDTIEQAAPIAEDTSLDFCVSNTDSDWFVTTVGGCQELTVSTSSSDVLGWSFHWLGIYDMIGTRLLASDSGYQPYDAANYMSVSLPVTQTSTYLIKSQGTQDKTRKQQHIRVSTNILGLVDDDFLWPQTEGSREEYRTRPFWTEVKPMGTCTVEVQNATDYLDITIPAIETDLMPGDCSAPRFMQATCQDDFCVQTEVEITGENAGNTWAGLLVWEDEDNFCAFEVNSLQELAVRQAVNGQYEYTELWAAETAASELRVVRQNHWLHFFVLDDTQAWQRVHAVEHPANLGPDDGMSQVGLYATNTTDDAAGGARFASFETRDATVPVNDSIDTPILISGRDLSVGEPFVFVQDVSNATTNTEDDVECAYGQGHHSVWFQYHPDGEPHTISISTVGSSYDTYLNEITYSAIHGQYWPHYHCNNDNVPGTQNETIMVTTISPSVPYEIPWFDIEVASEAEFGGELVFTIDLLEEPEGPCSDAQEPNDIAQQAVPIDVGGAATFCVSEPDPCDWFSFHVDSCSILRLMGFNDGECDDANQLVESLRLYDQSGSLLLAEDATEESCGINIHYPVVDGEDFALQVCGNSTVAEPSTQFYIGVLTDSLELVDDDFFWWLDYGEHENQYLWKASESGDSYTIEVAAETGYLRMEIPGATPQLRFMQTTCQTDFCVETEVSFGYWALNDHSGGLIVWDDTDNSLAFGTNGIGNLLYRRELNGEVDRVYIPGATAPNGRLRIARQGDWVALYAEDAAGTWQLAETVYYPQNAGLADETTQVGLFLQSLNQYDSGSAQFNYFGTCDIEPIETPTPDPSLTVVATRTATPTASPSLTPSVTATPSVTPSLSPTPGGTSHSLLALPVILKSFDPSRAPTRAPTATRTNTLPGPTRTPTCTPTPSYTGYLDLHIAQDSHDGFESEAIFDIDGDIWNRNWIGTDQHVVTGLIFDDVGLEQGARITAAVLTCRGHGTDGVATARVRAFAQDSCAAFEADGSNRPTTRPTTGAYVDWTNDWRFEWQAFASPDLATVVQEVVNRRGWSSGNRLGLKISNPTGTGTNWCIVDYASGAYPEEGGHEVTLRVEYEIYGQ